MTDKISQQLHALAKSMDKVMYDGMRKIFDDSSTRKKELTTAEIVIAYSKCVSLLTAHTLASLTKLTCKHPSIDAMHVLLKHYKELLEEDLTAYEGSFYDET